MEIRRFRTVKITIVVVALFAVGAAAYAHTTEQKAFLSGDKVVPGPGDADARGRAIIKTASEANTICYELRWSGIRRVRSAHIHHGSKTEVGEKELTLFASTRGRRSPVDGCKHDLSVELIEHLETRPHYVDLHSGGSPEGAARGQLSVVSEGG